MFSEKHNPKRTLLLILLFFILNSTFYIAQATIRYVSHSGNNTPPYTSWATAADSIMSAINISVFGDTIYVANGVYIEKVTMIHGLTLVGAGMDSCIIDTRTIATPPSYYAVTMKDECSIEGFHIIVLNTQGGTAGIRSSPGGNDSLYFQGKMFNNKISKADRGIIASNSFLTIRSNIFEDVRRGIDVSALDTSVLDSIYNNYLFQIISEGIGTDLACRGIIHNNIIYMSSGLTTGIGIASAGASKIFNNLIIGNNSDEGIALNVLPSEIYNNVVFNNFDEGIRFLGPNILKNNLVIGANRGYRLATGSSDSVSFNNAWNNSFNYYDFTPDSTNLTVDPMLVNEDSMDFHLQMYSPLIDAGDPNILDLDGSRSDIGLFGGPYGEEYTYRDLAPKPPSNLTAEYDSGLVKLIWNKNTEGDFYRYRVYRDTVPNFMYDTTKIIAVVADTFYYDDLPEIFIAGNYYYKLTATDSTGHQSAPSEEVHITITGIPEAPPIVVEHYQLLNNYPNPFNSSTVIPYRLKEAGYIKLYVYDIKGELVRTLVNEYQSAGYYEARFTPTRDEKKLGEFSEGWWTGYNDDIATGIYIYQFMVRGEGDIPVFSDIKKMIYLK